jgi:hypothetical protein
MGNFKFYIEYSYNNNYNTIGIFYFKKYLFIIIMIWKLLSSRFQIHVINSKLYNL